MTIDFTPIARPGFVRRAKRTDVWAGRSQAIQLLQLHRLVDYAAATEVGRLYDFAELAEAVGNPASKGGAERLAVLYDSFRSRVPLRQYEEIRADVMRMVAGERDVLWPGICRDYAQSSGTSGGRSKYIPVTADSLRFNHYPGGADCVAHYLRLNPRSRMFAGKGFILGGSYASELKPKDPRVKVGDLSATLITHIPPLAGMFRVPDRRTALLSDWNEKLPLLAEKAMNADVTNISGVPSWFLGVIKRICELKGVEKISDVWPNLEVFFHGGISFAPYRDLYRSLTDPAKMHFLETYNASEGFFAVQNDFADPAMLLLIDCGIFFEFLPHGGEVLAPWEVEEGRTYELVITSCNGLWRYRTGDTVRVESTDPVKITVAGRTHSFINAFGEELMEDNAERAIAEACAATDAEIRNYTAAPRYADGHRRGAHQWAVEWEREPASTADFASRLDAALRRLNSDYDAKRSGNLFLDPPEVITLPEGTFDRWLHSSGTHRLGGQRKVPRLSNDRHIIDALLMK